MAIGYTFFMENINQAFKTGGAMTKNIGKTILVALIIIVVLIFLFKIYIVIDPGEKAVIFNKATGNLRVTPNEGFYFLVPLVEEPTVYDMKARTYTMSIATLEGEIKGDDSLQALTSDGQTVLLDISVRYHPDPDNLDKLHRRLGIDFVNKVIRPQVRSTVRMIVSEYPVLDVYSGKRMLIQSAIEKGLRESFKKNFITLEEVLLRNVQFSREFQQAIENKQIAQQDAQRMKYVLERQEQEKKRKIIEAEGESESLRLKGKALADNPQLIQYEYIKLLAPNVQAIVTDQNTIFNFSDFLKNQKK
jgi:regulator of protease activity HflC (stomatin/prohibitin superfamily)